MKKFEIRFGLYAGLVNIFLSLFNWYLIAQPFGYNVSEIFGYLSMVVALLFIPIGIKYYKEKLNNGAVTFKEAAKVGMGISLVSAVITFCYSTLYFVVLGDDFLAWYQDSFTDEELKVMQLQLESLPDYVMAPWFQGLIMFFTVILIGIIITALSGLIFRAKKE